MPQPKVNIAGSDGDLVGVTDNRLNVNVSPGAGDGITSHTQLVVGTTLAQLSVELSSISAHVKEMIFQAAVDNTGFIMVGNENITSNDTIGIRINAGDMLVLPVNSTVDTYVRGSEAGQQVNISIII
tara:strand:+ start:201 stop:581 length:381 start_codon:yes stop_codon:yes gene_type:complete